LIEGPLGCPGLNIHDDVRYSMALYVSGGIGVTHSTALPSPYSMIRSTMAAPCSFFAVRGLYEMLNTLQVLMSKRRVTATTRWHPVWLPVSRKMKSM
jgi:hypothetical protein